jgi:hypothetical protein
MIRVPTFAGIAGGRMTQRPRPAGGITRIEQLQFR